MIKRFFYYIKNCFYYNSFKQKNDAIKVLKKIKRQKKNIYIEEIRKQLIQNKDTIFTKDYGAGSKIGQNKTISKITKISVSSRKKCEFIQKVVESFNVHTAIEFGTSLGISSMYIKNASTNPKLTTIEGDKKISQIANNNFKTLQIEINNICKTFDSFIETYNKNDKTDFFYIDGNHTKSATIRYFQFALEIINDNGVILIDDIRWSDQMLDAWNEIFTTQQKGLFVDTGQMGLYISKDVEKKLTCVPKIF